MNRWPNVNDCEKVGKLYQVWRSCRRQQQQQQQQSDAQPQTSQPLTFKMSFGRNKSDLIRAFYAADKDGDGALDLFEYVAMFHDQVSFQLLFML